MNLMRGRANKRSRDARPEASWRALSKGEIALRSPSKIKGSLPISFTFAASFSHSSRTRST